MSEPDQDEMRRKRLARLSGQPTSTPPSGEKSKPAQVNMWLVKENDQKVEDIKVSLITVSIKSDLQ